MKRGWRHQPEIHRFADTHIRQDVLNQNQHKETINDAKTEKGGFSFYDFSFVNATAPSLKQYS